MSFDNSNFNNKNGRNNNRRKRRWYYPAPPPTCDNPATNCQNSNKKAKHSIDTGVASSGTVPINGDIRQELFKQYEKERAENKKQVEKMEEQLHEYFHKTKTPYSYIDNNGIYSFTPSAAPLQPPSSVGSTKNAATTAHVSAQVGTNPFMNMTFNPFVPSTSATLLSNTTSLPTLWTSIIPIKIAEPSTNTSAAAAAVTASSLGHPGPVTEKTPVVQTIEICEKIEHINDLIALCDKYPLADDKKYNINMSAIHAIREPLTDLSNMVGMETIKRTMVDQILYYLQELHIPEPNKLETRNTNNAEKTEPQTEASAKPLFNPFAPSFPSPFAAPFPAAPFPAFQASSSTTLPFNIKKNNWTNNSVTDDFALPTKGDFMHTVIYGPPGSGKTEVAKIIGRIFSNLGILNKKIFKKVSRNDLVAGYLGQTAIKTKDMIKASLGGVLFIDEAYSLGNSEKRDSFAKECIDTLCEALSEHKHNWMVIIAGYEKELNDCFFSLNEGLNSRFTWRFKLDPYKPSELKSIYEKQVRDYGWKMIENDATTEVIPETWFASRMDYFTTYGRDMETLFTKTKIAHSRRVFCLPMSEKKIITFADLENGFKLFTENPEVNERKERGIGGPYMKTLYL
jgi:hypothetical protein